MRHLNRGDVSADKGESVSAKIKIGTADFCFGSADFQNVSDTLRLYNCTFLILPQNAFRAVMA